MNQAFWMGILAICGALLALFAASFLLEKLAPATLWDKLALPLTGGAGHCEEEGKDAQSDH